jgi:hypothetical protein
MRFPIKKHPRRPATHIPMVRAIFIKLTLPSPWLKRVSRNAERAARAPLSDPRCALGALPNMIALVGESHAMPLSPNDLAMLERLGTDNVRQRLDHAGPGAGAVIPGLGPHPGMTRGWRLYRAT